MTPSISPSTIITATKTLSSSRIKGQHHPTSALAVATLSLLSALLYSFIVQYAVHWWCYIVSVSLADVHFVLFSSLARLMNCVCMNFSWKQLVRLALPNGLHLNVHLHFPLHLIDYRLMNSLACCYLGFFLPNFP